MGPYSGRSRPSTLPVHLPAATRMVHGRGQGVHRVAGFADQRQELVARREASLAHAIFELMQIADDRLQAHSRRARVRTFSVLLGDCGTVIGRKVRPERCRSKSRILWSYIKTLSAPRVPKSNLKSVRVRVWHAVCEWWLSKLRCPSLDRFQAQPTWEMSAN